MEILTIQEVKNASERNLVKAFDKTIKAFQNSSIFFEKKLQQDLLKIKWYLPSIYKNKKEIEKLKKKHIFNIIEYYDNSTDISGIIFYSERYAGFRHLIGNFSFERSHAEIHCNLDNETPERISMFQKLLLEKGANDVWVENIQMKKSRPGMKLCLLVEKNLCLEYASWLLENTKSLGVRYHDVHRLEVFRYKKNDREKVYYTLTGQKQTKEEFENIENKFREKN